MNDLEKALYKYNNTFRPTSEILEEHGLSLQKIYEIPADTRGIRK